MGIINTTFPFVPNLMEKDISCIKVPLLAVRSVDEKDIGGSDE